MLPENIYRAKLKVIKLKETFIYDFRITPGEEYVHLGDI